MNRNISIMVDSNGRKIVVIHDIIFKGKRKIDWKDVEQYLKRYVGNVYEIATNQEFSINQKEKHKNNAKYGWYRYDSRFALPVINENGELERYNVFKVRMLVRHAENGKKYLYDILGIKKETSKPL
ncbi:MAG: hypothetical protein IJA27_00250 [Lachnospiraceae bacterium]|nr:hypothetical protein [Lachnospiraceae bacterium]